MDKILHERSQLPDPERCFSSEDEKLVLEFYIGEARETGGNVTVYQQQPEALDAFDAMRGFFRNVAEEDRDLLLDMGFNGSVVSFGNIANYQELVRHLGYKWNVEQSTEEGLQRKLIRFAYPSVNYLNEVLDEISPNEGMRYKQFNGGPYTAIDWAEAFIDNKALIANEHPYTFHDHVALHTLGSLGLQGEFLDGLRRFTEAYLIRHQAEVALPLVPNIKQWQVERFLHPSHQILRALLRQVDGLTGRLANEIFLPERETIGIVLIPPLESTVRSAYILGDSRNSVPSWVIEEPEHGTMLRYVDEVEARYNKLSAAILQLAA